MKENSSGKNVSAMERALEEGTKMNQNRKDLSEKVGRIVSNLKAFGYDVSTFQPRSVVPNRGLGPVFQLVLKVDDLDSDTNIQLVAGGLNKLKVVEHTDQVIAIKPVRVGEAGSTYRFRGDGVVEILDLRGSTAFIDFNIGEKK